MSKSDSILLSLNNEKLENILYKIRRGNTINDAVTSEGIFRRDFNEWMKIGISAQQINPSMQTDMQRQCALLRLKIEQAQAEHRCIAVEKIGAAGDSDWRANAWLLAKAPGSEWDKKETVLGVVNLDEKSEAGSALDELKKKMLGEG